MNRPTSQPHSPLPHGLWSAQRLLQHLNQASRPILFSSTYWINLFAQHKLIHCLTFFHRLSDRILVTCITNTFRVVWKSLNWEPRPERNKNFDKKNFTKMWNTKHLSRHSESQSIPPASPASLPGALHWLWSVLAQGPCNHIYIDREIGHLTIWPILYIKFFHNEVHPECCWSTSPCPQGLSGEHLGLKWAFNIFSASGSNKN